MSAAVDTLDELVQKASKDERETPRDLFHALHGEYGFTLDAASSHLNHLVQRYCTLEGTFDDGTLSDDRDGLLYPWEGERVWCNPPFSVIAPWLEKSWHDAPEVACLLLPANRMEQSLWQSYVEPYRDRPGSPLTTRFLAGRRHFTVDGGKPIMQPPRVSKRTSRPLKQTRSAPEFGVVLCIWDRRVPGALRHTRQSFSAP